MLSLMVLLSLAAAPPSPSNHLTTASRSAPSIDLQGADPKQTQNGQTTAASVDNASSNQTELRTGIELTRQGRFAEAIPHLVAARGSGTNEYVSNFNLALCYVATRQPKLAEPILVNLKDTGHATAEVWNLLAQAYIGDAQSDNAMNALQHAAAITPNDEKLYSFVSDACIDSRNNDLGLKVVELGLTNLPHSARLHYERGVFLTALDRFDMAKKDFDLASQLAPGTDIGYLASSHEDLIEGNTADAISVARSAVARGDDNYVLLQILGEALIRSGINPGDPGFDEAKTALEKSVRLHPGYSRSHISLGKLYLMAGSTDEAIAQLEQARVLDPRNPAVYSYLAAAYRSKGDIAQAKQALAILAQLNQEQITAIRDAGTAAGEHRGAENGIRNQ